MQNYPVGRPVISVARPGKWGNPWAVGKPGPLGRKPMDQAGAVGFFCEMLDDTEMRTAVGYPSDEEIRRELRGKHLACWCAPGTPCHADILLKIANG